jgi:hypothetical protein
MRNTANRWPMRDTQVALSVAGDWLSIKVAV